MQSLFYQYVVDKTFQELLEDKFQPHSSNETVGPNPLTYEEANALRYVAGYVCHKVHDGQTTSMSDGLV